MRPRRKYRNIVKHITTLQLTQPDDLGEFSDAELFTDLTSGRGTSLFLGQYSKKGITFALNVLGIFEHLEKLGLKNLTVDIDTSRPFQHIFRMHHIDDDQQALIIELVMRRGTFSLPEEIQNQMIKQSYDILIIEWLLLQNPLASFSKKRPQLPGQNYPGLGLGSSALEIFYWIGRRTKADGILIVPNYLHTAYFYSREFYFIDAKKQSMLIAIQRDLLKKKNLSQVSWACEEEKIINKENSSPLKWEPSEMILPVSKAMNDYFFSVYYRSHVEKNKLNFSFTIEKGYKKDFDENWKAV